MRRNLLVGVVLMVAAVVVVFVSDLFDLKLDSAALLGLAVGAVVALVPDGNPATRLIGFVVGIVAAWVGYLLRAGLLPDSVGGRSVAVVIVLAVCVALAAATTGRVPLWSSLLGAAAMVGAYEYSYAAAPPEVMSTSVSAVTALLMTSAVGFLVPALLAPRESRRTTSFVSRRSAADDETTSFDDIMEKSK
jgi:hypothetical protein